MRSSGAKGAVAATMVLLACQAISGPTPVGAQKQDGSVSSREAGALPAGRAAFEVRPAALIEVDARLDESAWAEAEAIPLPLEIGPGDNTAAVVETNCRITFDEENLYLGCEARDPDPSRIRAFLTDRDGIFGNNDRISFLIDPFNDLRRGWVFEVSPLGVQADLVFDERTDEFDESWDAIWSSAGRITDDGYVIEAAIPFRSLRFPATEGVQTWRFWINRMRPRDDAYRIMRTNTRIRGEACQLCQAPVLVGLHGIAQGRNVEITPTLVGTRSDAVPEESAEAPLTPGSVEWDPGLDARWSVTTDLALNATVNPDFSQVEADDPQLDANNRFALFFPEKRPFFLEGADLFQTPLQAVFTRSVAEPVAGAKLTGKLGRQGIGLLVTRDRVNNLLLPGPYTSATVQAEEDVSGVMARYRRDLGGRHTVGALYTGRIGDSAYRNHVGGADAFFQPTSAMTLDLQLLASSTEYDLSIVDALDQPAGSFSGIAMFGRGGFDGRHWGAAVEFRQLGRGFRADGGFINQVDLRYYDVSGRRSFYGEAGDPFARFDVDGGVFHIETTAGALVQRGTWLNLRYEGPRQSEAWVNPVRRRERFAGRTFELFTTYQGFTVRPTGILRVGVSSHAGTGVDIRNERKVGDLRISPSLDVQLGRKGEVGLSHHWQRLTLEGAPVLTTQVGQLRTVYNFSARALLRALVQYRHTERNPATNPGLEEAITESVFTSLLFSYKVNPLTVVFLGYSDDRAGFEDAMSTRSHFGLRQRSFFLKLGYAWRP